MRKAYVEHDLVDGYDYRHFGGAGGKYVFHRDCSIINSMTGLFPGLLLDIPCGTGIYSRVIQANGNRVIAADGSMLMLEKVGQGENILPRTLCNANWLPFQDNTFDAVMSIRLFQHLPKQEVTSILRELKRVIKPGGNVVFDAFRWSPKQIHLFARLLRGEFFVLSATDVEEILARVGLRKVQAVPSYLFSPIIYRKLPIAVIKGLGFLERIVPAQWLLRTFWKCTKDDADSDPS